MEVIVLGIILLVGIFFDVARCIGLAFLIEYIFYGYTDVMMMPHFWIIFWIFFVGGIIVWAFVKDK